MRIESIVLLCVLTLGTSSCAMPAGSSSTQTENEHRTATPASQEIGDWTTENVAGFEVSVAKNSADDLVRTIYVLAAPIAFSERNLTMIFAGFSAAYAEPPALRVTIMSDRARLKAAADGHMMVIYSGHGKDRSGPSDQVDTTVRKDTDRRVARYIRSFDGDEEFFWYTPDANSAAEIKVSLKTRPELAYTGDIDWDLLVAAEKGNKARVRDLLGRGADANARDRHGFSAVSKAALYGYVAIVEMLLEKGADPNARDEHEWTPLMSAASNGDPRIVELLLRKGAQVDVRDRFGNTPLLVAAGHTEADFETGRARALTNVTVLLDKGVDVNLTGRNGETALFRAITAEDITLVRFLLEKGANPNVMNVNGLTALKAAQSKGNADIVELLIKAGARD